MRPYGIVIAALVALILPISASSADPAARAVGSSKTGVVAPLVSTTGWTTYHHDNSRNGYDANAPAFTGGPFSTWNKTVDQAVYAEPLAFAGRAYVATMGDSAYAFDGATGNQVWARTGGTALGTPSTATYCSFNPGHIGVVSVPTTGTAIDHVYQPQTSCQNAAGIWGPSGIAMDGAGSLYVATGNGNGCYGRTSSPCGSLTMWDHGDGVIKLDATLTQTDS